MTTLAEFKEIEAKATKGPFCIDTTINSGCYGGGPDLRQGYASHVVYDKNGKTIFDTLNSEVAVVNDFDFSYATDEQGLIDTRCFAISRTALPALIAVAEGMAGALEKAHSCIWDGHYGKGLSVGYVRAVDEKINKALAAFEAWKDNIEKGD